GGCQGRWRPLKPGSADTHERPPARCAFATDPPGTWTGAPAGPARRAGPAGRPSGKPPRAADGPSRLPLVEPEYQAVVAHAGRDKNAINIHVVADHPHRAVAKDDVEPGRVGGAEHAVIAAVVVRARVDRILLRLIGYADVRGDGGEDADD